MNVRVRDLAGAALVSLAALAVAGGYIDARFLQHSSPASPYPLGVPTLPARVNQSAALATVARQFGPSLLSRHRVTAQYGSYAVRESYPQGVSGSHSVQMWNVWRVTVSGVSIDRPCADIVVHGSARCPVAHTFVVLVDGQSGQEIKAAAY